VRAAAERLGVTTRPCCDASPARGTPRGADVRKLPSGYRLTAAGEEILEFADQMEASSHQLETRVFGRDQGVRGFCGDAGTAPRDTPAHAGLRRFRAAASGHRDGNLVVRRAGKSDQPRGRRRGSASSTTAKPCRSIFTA